MTFKPQVIPKKTKNTMDYETYLSVKDSHETHKGIMAELQEQYTYWNNRRLGAEFGSTEHTVALYSMDALMEQMRPLAKELKEEEECIKFFEET